jgi:hypothetical protein
VGGLFALLLPIALVAGIGLGERLTAERWEAAHATIAEVAQAADRVVEPSDAAPEDEGGWLEQLRQRLETTRDLVSGYYRSAGVFWDEARNLLDA